MTKAMCFNGPQPNHQLKINDIQIEWVKDHKYLGILFDNRLSFNNHVQYLLTKCHKRINVMKSLTTINKGAYAKVLITYYVTAVRSLIDYAAPVLTNISQKNMQELQKIQNAAMRIALGAPKWTSIFNMHKETNLLPIKDRIQQINCNIIIKTMFQKPRILSNQISENTISFYIDPILETIKNSGIDINDIVANTNHQDIHTYKPWESVPAELLIKRFVASKKTANHQILSTKYIKYIKEINSNKDLIIYTDGSVDIINQRAGAAAVIRDSKNRTLQTIKRRINSGVSSLQTELVAIALALAETKNLVSLNLVIHTDSMNAILDLRKTEPDSNVSLIKTIQSLINLHNENDNRITINYIPSHIGIHGNDLADTAAKEALSKIEIDHIIKPEFKALKNKIIKYLIKKNCISKLLPHSITDSILHYHLATESIPEVKTKNRQLEVNIIRLRLGYKTYSQLTEKQTVCSRCLRILNKPLVHYLSGCQSLYPYYKNIREQAETAANNLNHILKNEQILHDLIIKYPPPR